MNALNLANVAYATAVKALALNANVPDPLFYVFVNEKADLPAAVAGVITLAANTVYVPTTAIDLVGDRLQCSANTAIAGGSSASCGFLSTGLAAGTALLSSAFTLPMRHVFFTHGTALALSGSPGQILVWSEVNFINCDTIGTIENYTNFVADRCQLVNCGALTFDGTIGTVALTGSLVAPKVGGTGIIIPAGPGAQITLRFRMNNTSVIAGDVTTTGLSVQSSAFPNASSFIVNQCNFSGPGTRLTGISSTDNEALILVTAGIENSADVAQYSMSGNLVATALSGVGAPGDFLKIAGVTVAGLAEKFDLTVASNRAVYVGVLTSIFKVTATVTVTGGANKDVAIRIAKNGATAAASNSTAATGAGGRASAVPCQDLQMLAGPTDFIEVWIANDTDLTDLTVTDLTLIITRAT